MVLYLVKHITLENVRPRCGEIHMNNKSLREAYILIMTFYGWIRRIITTEWQIILFGFKTSCLVKFN
jgi:hypothetical protein